MSLKPQKAHDLVELVVRLAPSVSSFTGASAVLGVDLLLDFKDFVFDLA